MRRRHSLLVPFLAVLALLPARRGACQDGDAAAAPPYLADRGTGVPTSMFGSYVRRHELLVYPFFEYYRDANLEYQPDEFGVPSAVERRGRYRASELLLFLAYGLGDNVAVELEASHISASLEKSPDDASALPRRLEESGPGDVEGQLRWRWLGERASRPELFSYYEVVFPTGKRDSLIGTADWEHALGLGLVKGFGFGTLTARGAVEYHDAEGALELGEYAVEYLKRLSPRFTLFLALEGAQDELGLITELQWHLSERVYVKLNNGFGLTSKSTDWAPEYGVVFRF